MPPGPTATPRIFYQIDSPLTIPDKASLNCFFISLEVRKSKQLGRLSHDRRLGNRNISTARQIYLFRNSSEVRACRRTKLNLAKLGSTVGAPAKYLNPLGLSGQDPEIPRHLIRPQVSKTSSRFGPFLPTIYAPFPPYQGRNWSFSRLAFRAVGRVREIRPDRRPRLRVRSG
jgi:hypothetical protein